MTSYSSSRVGSGNVPFRLRLRDAHGSARLNKVAAGQINTSSLTKGILEENWKAFLAEFESANKKPKCCNKCMQNSCDDVFSCNFIDEDSSSSKDTKPVWVAALGLWLSPARALIFEKYWGKLILGQRVFSSDPAPHIPRCCHCKLPYISDELKNELMRKNALDAQRRLQRLREAYKIQELRDIKEVNAKLAEFKKTIRDTSQQFKNRGKHLQGQGNRNTKPRLTASKTKTTMTKKTPVLPKIPAIVTDMVDKSLTGSPSPKSVSKFSEGKLSRFHGDISVSDILSYSSGGFDFDETRIDEELLLLDGIESSDSISLQATTPELAPVELPDWVRDYLNKRKQAQNEIDAACQGPQKDMPVPVWVESVYDNGETTVIAAEVSQPPHGAGRGLDFTGSLMAKNAPLPIGMESRDVHNMQITASSEQGPYYKAHEARLNNKPKGKNIGAWCPKKHDNYQWLQIDIGQIRNIQQIATQGMPIESVRRPKDKRWVESFALSYSDNGDHWEYFNDENGNPNTFLANSDLVNTAKNSFVSGLRTRYVRIHPTSWNSGIALRVEIYVEREIDQPKNDKELTDDVVTEVTAVEVPLSDQSSSNESSDEESDSASEYIFGDHDDEELLSTGELETMEKQQTMSVELEEIANSLRGSVYEESKYGISLEELSGDYGIMMRPPSSVGSQNGNEEPKPKSRGGQSMRKSNLAINRKVEDMIEQEKCERRKITFRSVVRRLMSIPNSSTGLTLDEDDADKDEFLSKYCILRDGQKILYARAFHQVDDDCDGLIDKDALMAGLKSLKLNSLKESEMNYILKIIDVFEEKSEDGIDIKTFNVIAAFADRLKNVDSFTRDIIRGTNFATLYLHAHKTRDLFERMLERGETTISSEQFLIELEAGGVKMEGQDVVRKYTNGKKFLDFLDFAIYFPLFLYTHEQIMSTPL